METYKFDKSMELFNRARAVIPGGIYGHLSPAVLVPGKYPYYAQRGEGGYYWDPDGNRYIDWMCGYGPMILGYNHPKVEAAVDEQRKNADCFNHPTPVMVELAELLVDTVKIADWAIFAKNGSDTTTYAVQVARQSTGRDKVIACKGAYHGAHAWCTPGHGGLTDADRVNVLMSEWNNLELFRKLVDEHPNQVAAIILTPYHHPAFADSVLPAPGFYEGIRSLCDRNGIVLIIDDVRAGFRLDLRGSDQYFGFDADILCFSKALGNTYPISACVGRDDLRLSASDVFFTGSFWGGGISMAAAIATIKELKETNAVAHMMHIGKLLQDGIRETGAKHGYEMSVTGPPTIPYASFACERDFMRQQVFCAEVTARGAFFHPHHNWFISAAHTEADVEHTLTACDEAFAIVKEKFND